LCPVIDCHAAAADDILLKPPPPKKNGSARRRRRSKSPGALVFLFARIFYNITFTVN